jgi:hypothetical protein
VVNVPSAPKGLTVQTVANRHFIRHYLEMVAAMFGGMLVLGTSPPSRWRRSG